MSGVEFLTSLEMGLIYSIVAVGIYLTFRIIDFPDLTCDGSFVLGAALSAGLIQHDMHVCFALLLSAGGGVIAGLATGILHIKLRMSPLLAGILVAFMLYSINLRVMGGVPNITLSESLFTQYPGFSTIGILSSLSLVIWYCLSRFLDTDFGLGLRSVGENPKLGPLLGVNPRSMVLVGLGISNGLVALGGGLFAHHQEFTDISQGVGTVIVGLAAVMIGEKLLPFRSLWVCILSCFAGSILYRLIVALALNANFLGLESYDLNLITGGLVIGVMMIPQRHKRRKISVIQETVSLKTNGDHHADA